MKKIILMLAVVFAAANMSAQTVGFGVKAGANLYNISNSPDGCENMVGFNVGVLLNLPLSSSDDFKYSLQPELYYSLQGQKDSKPNYSDKSKLSYLNIPVLLKYRLNDNLSVEVGPQFSYLIDANDKQKLNGVETTVNLMDCMDRLDYGACLGVTYMVKDNIGVQVRYNYGFTEIYRQNKVGESNHSNRGASLSAVYMF